MNNGRSAADPDKVGAQWVDRFLMPLLRERLLRGEERRLACLQIESDDTSVQRGEAERLRQNGHHCDVVLCRTRGSADAVDPTNLPLASNYYDFVMTGRFGRMAVGRERRVRFARELARVCRMDGALLMTIGNRLFPFDLSANSSFLHGPRDRKLVTLRDLEEAFVVQAGFRAVHRLSVAGHFTWSRARGPGKLVARLLEAHWQRLAVPSRRWLYASPLNPVFVVWIER